MKKSKTKSYTIGIAVFMVLAIIIFFGRIVDFLVNIQWYKQLGYLSVYFTRIKATLLLMVPLFIILYIGIWLYYKGIRKNIIKMRKVIEVNTDRRKLERKIFILANTLFSLFVSYLVASSFWYKILQFLNSSDFSVKDPIFNKDISFYIFKLPLIDSLYQAAMGLLVFIVIITVATFFITLTSGITGGFKKDLVIDSDTIKNGLIQFAGKQLAVIAGLFLMLGALGFFLKGYKIMYSSNGAVYGAGYTDVKVTLLMSRVLAVACLISAVVVFVSLLKSKVKPIVISIAAIVVLMIVNAAASVVVENLMVKSNQMAYEEQYIKNDIAYTRKAYNLDNLEDVSYPVSNTLNKKDIENNKDIIDNIKLNSYKQSLDFYNQVQAMKYYYNFNDIDIDRYTVNGKYTQTFLAPREIKSDSITPATWLNQHIIYTHGYGVVMSKVSSVTSEGQPDFIVRDIPVDNESGIKVDNPRIYFGESTNEYAIVGTTAEEFDYPNGSSNKYNKYEGNAGIKLNFGNKLLFGLAEQDPNFLTSKYITGDSKIIINRNIMDRVNAIAPFLKYDSDPYMVAADGKLYWIVDGYTYSDMYPYSQPTNGLNYIRNSVKVTIDAYNGDVNFYIVDDKDPIIKSYDGIFKGLFKKASEIPQAIKEHFRYPEDLFNIQCQVLGKYHVTDPVSFMTGEDLWQVATTQKDVSQDKSASETSYMVTRLPGETKEEMVLLNYFNMNNKENMSAMLGVRMDGDNYGKMVLYRFPTQQTVYGPFLFQNNIKQDTDISKELSLWNTNGSHVEFGDTIILPVNNSLLYVEPLYIIADGKNSIPEMKRVIVSNGDKIIMAEGIDKALATIFGIDNGGSAPTTGPATPGQTSGGVSSEVLKQAKAFYDSALEAQKQGDWAKYGEYIKKLGDILGGTGQLQTEQQAQPQGQTTK
ncbi:MAG: UPF0182 family protein [Bacillota bacterium]|nr:UPF0182 family protein [Bacillota bacterium]